MGSIPTSAHGEGSVVVGVYDVYDTTEEPYMGQSEDEGNPFPVLQPEHKIRSDGLSGVAFPRTLDSPNPT